MGRTITHDFWFCNCEQNSTHASEELYCDRCCTYKEEGYETFKEDILAMLFERPADKTFHTQRIEPVEPELSTYDHEFIMPSEL